MVTDAAAEADDFDELPPDTSRALNRLAGGQLGRKQQKLTRRKHMPRAHAPKRRTKIDALVTHPEWKLLRELVFARAGQRCEKCGRHRDQVGLDPHHRQLLSRGGADVASNLAALCRECHDWCHRNPLAATGLGFIVPSRADPAARGMLLHDGRLVLLDDAGGYVLAG
jgi:5-methylcytosine-specific restriction endonuclease McrA